MQNVQNIQNSPSLIDLILQPEHDSYRNLLHFKPLSHQICRGLTFIGTCLQQSENPETKWAKFKIGLAQGIVGVGYALNTVVAVIESIAALTFSILALSLHAITRARSTMLQKFTLKLCAYSIHSIGVTGLQIYCLKKGFFSKYHTLNAAANHSMHAISAIMSQFIGYGFDRWAGRNPASNDQRPSPSVIRIIRILIELAPAILNDITRGAARDFAVHLRDNQNNPDLQVFLQNNPNYTEILQRFNYGEVRSNALYRGQILQLIGNYFIQAGILRRFSANLNERPMASPAQAPEQIQVFGINNNEKDRNYQIELTVLIKKTFIDLYYNEDLISMLSDDKTKPQKEQVEEGRDNLETLFGDAATKFAHYVQYQELQSPIQCPETFAAHELQPYNNRYELIKDAKKRLETLSPEEDKILVEMLLKTAEFDLNACGLKDERKAFIQKLYTDIGVLDNQLHHGKLLAQKFVNVQELTQGNFNEAFGAKNMFDICKEAIEEIKARSKTEDQTQSSP